MVCDLLSVITARLDAAYAVELYGSEAGIAAYARALEPLIGAFTIVRAEGRITIQGARASIYVRPDRVQVFAGYEMTRAEGEQLARETIRIAEALALPLAQERLVNKIKAAYGQLAVLSDTRQGAARVTRVRIPL